eukprot:9780909-Alexandrium_andersonii.AAC.1
MPRLSELYGRVRPIMGGRSTCTTSPSATYRSARGLPRGVRSSFGAFGHCSALGLCAPEDPSAPALWVFPSLGSPVSDK